MSKSAYILILLLGSVSSVLSELSSDYKDPFSDRSIIEQNKYQKKITEAEWAAFKNQPFGFENLGIKRQFDFLGLGDSKHLNYEMELIDLSNDMENEESKMIAIDLIYESWGNKGRENGYVILPQSFYRKIDSDKDSKRVLENWTILQIKDEDFRLLYQSTDPPYSKLKKWQLRLGRVPMITWAFID